jgi:hypothetical protein
VPRVSRFSLPGEKWFPYKAIKTVRKLEASAVNGLKTVNCLASTDGEFRWGRTWSCCLVRTDWSSKRLGIRAILGWSIIRTDFSYLSSVPQDDVQQHLNLASVTHHLQSHSKNLTFSELQMNFPVLEVIHYNALQAIKINKYIHKQINKCNFDLNVKRTFTLSCHRARLSYRTESLHSPAYPVAAAQRDDKRQRVLKVYKT